MHKAFDNILLYNIMSTKKSTKKIKETVDIDDSDLINAFASTTNKSPNKEKPPKSKKAYYRDTTPKLETPKLETHKLETHKVKTPEDLSKVIQDANVFYVGDDFKNVKSNKLEDYELSPADLTIINENMQTITNSLRNMINPTFVSRFTSTSGKFLNLFNTKPKNKAQTKDNIAHISFHTLNSLYHFKIRKPELITPPLEPIDDPDKKYTITFKMYKHKTTHVISAEIIKGVHNPNTEIECPDEIIETFQFVLDNIVRCLNENRGGRTRRHKRITNERSRRRRRMR